MKSDRNGQQEYSTQEISEVVARYRGGGATVARFAKEEGIPAGRLHYWIYQKHSSKPRKRWPKRSEVASAPLFHEVKIAAPVSPSEDWAAEISLPKGLAIRFSAAAMPAWIGSVVQALQRPC